jgi:hypothetical protein
MEAVSQMKPLKPYDDFFTAEICLQAALDETPAHLHDMDLIGRLAGTIPSLADAIYSERFPNASMTAQEKARHIVRTLHQMHGIRRQ